MYSSYFAQMLSGSLIFYVILMMIFRMNSNTTESNFNEHVIILLLAIAIGVHGLQHAYAEVNFDFNPLNDRWHYRLNQRLVKKRTE